MTSSTSNDKAPIETIPNVEIDTDNKLRLIFKNDRDEKMLMIACETLPKKEGIYSKLKECILTAFNWKFIRVKDEKILVNINSVAERTKLSKKEVKTMALNGTLFKKCDEMVQDITAKNQGYFTISLLTFICIHFL